MRIERAERKVQQARRLLETVCRDRAFYRRQAVRAERRLNVEIIRQELAELPPPKPTRENDLWDLLPHVIDIAVLNCQT